MSELIFSETSALFPVRLAHRSAGHAGLPGNDDLRPPTDCGALLVKTAKQFSQVVGPGAAEASSSEHPSDNLIARELAIHETNLARTCLFDPHLHLCPDGSRGRGGPWLPGEVRSKSPRVLSAADNHPRSVISARNKRFCHACADSAYPAGSAAWDPAWGLSSWHANP